MPPSSRSTALLAATAAGAALDADEVPVHVEDVAGTNVDGERWTATARLATDPERWVVGAMQRARARIGTVDDKTLGAHLAGQLGGVLGPLAAALGAGRVIDPASTQLLVWPGTFEHRPALGVHGCSVAVASGDPAAAEADVVLEDDGALLERFCATVVDPVLAPTLEAVHRRSTFARRAGEALALEGLLRPFARARSRRGPGWDADVAALSDRIGLARGLAPAFVPVASGEHADMVTVGGACCRYFRWPSGETCDFCVLKPVEERVRLWHHEVAELGG